MNYSHTTTVKRTTRKPARMQILIQTKHNVLEIAERPHHRMPLKECMSQRVEDSRNGTIAAPSGKLVFSARNRTKGPAVKWRAVGALLIEGALSVGAAMNCGRSTGL